jgi:hypothetical protein
MSSAVITEKYQDGRIKTMRSTVFPPPRDLEAEAKELDEFLSKRIPALEKELEKLQPGLERPQAQGNVSVWYSLGLGLRAICEEKDMDGVRERRWLWEAIQNLYATDRIKRVSRGPTRNHFEYCYRLSAIPRDAAEQVNWSEWVFFFDSRTVREEPRIDLWLRRRIIAGENIDRAFFRQFTRNLNQRIRRLDTSVLSDGELFKLYDSIWLKTKSDIGS